MFDFVEKKTTLPKFKPTEMRIFALQFLVNLFIRKHIMNAFLSWANNFANSVFYLSIVPDTKSRAVLSALLPTKYENSLSYAAQAWKLHFWLKLE